MADQFKLSYDSKNARINHLINTIFKDVTKDDIKVGYIDPTLGYIINVSICEANDYAKKNPGTTFIVKNADNSIQYLTINEVNTLTPDFLVTTKNPCGGIQTIKKCGEGPPRIEFFGGGGVGALANAIVGVDGTVLAVDVIAGGFGYKYPPIVQAIDECQYGSGATLTSELGNVTETLITFEDEDDFENYELCPDTTEGFGRNFGHDGEDLGPWEPGTYIDVGEDPIRKEIDEYQKSLLKSKNPFWTTKSTPPKSITSASKKYNIPYEVADVRWSKFMNSYAISPVPHSNVRGSDEAGRLFVFDWDVDFPYDGEYIFRGLCDNKSTLYVDNIEVFKLRSFNDAVEPTRKEFKAGPHKVRIDLLNLPIPDAQRKINTNFKDMRGYDDNPGANQGAPQQFGALNDLPSARSLGFSDADIRNYLETVYRFIPGKKIGPDMKKLLDDPTWGQPTPGRIITQIYNIDRNAPQKPSQIRRPGFDTTTTTIQPGVYLDLTQYRADEEVYCNFGTLFGNGPAINIPEVGIVEGRVDGTSGKAFVVGPGARDKNSTDHPGEVFLKGGKLYGPITIVPNPSYKESDLFIGMNYGQGGGAVELNQDIAFSNQRLLPYRDHIAALTGRGAEGGNGFGGVLSKESLNAFAKIDTQKAIDPDNNNLNTVTVEEVISFTLTTQGGFFRRITDPINVGSETRESTYVTVKGQEFEVIGNINPIFKNMRGYNDAPGTNQGAPQQFGALNDLPSARSLGFSDADIRNYLENVYKFIPGKKIGPDMQKLLDDPNWGRPPTQLANTPPSLSKASNIQNKTIFTTADYISKSDRTLWRSIPVSGKDSEFINRYGVIPIDPNSEISKAESSSGVQVIRWQFIEFPVDGNYNVQIMVGGSVVVYIGNRSGQGIVELGNGLTDIEQGGDETIFRNSGSEKSSETRFFKAGKYRIRTELLQKSSGFKDMRGYNDAPGTNQGAPQQFGALNDLPSARSLGFSDADIRNYLENVYKFIPGKKIGPEMKKLLDDPNWGRPPFTNLANTSFAMTIDLNFVEEVVSGASFNENPMGISVTIDAPSAPIPKEPAPIQTGRCPPNPIWTTRFPTSKEQWYPVTITTNRTPGTGKVHVWSKFMNRYAISPVPPFDTYDSQLKFKEMLGYDDTPGTDQGQPNQFGADNDLPSARSQGFSDADVRNYLENFYRHIPGKRIGPKMQTLLNDPNWGRAPSSNFGGGRSTSNIAGVTFINTWTVELPYRGAYGVRGLADNTGRLLIDGKEVAKMNAYQRPIPKLKKVFLEKGTHEITVEVFNTPIEKQYDISIKVFSTRDWEVSVPRSGGPIVSDIVLVDMLRYYTPDFAGEAGATHFFTTEPAKEGIDPNQFKLQGIGWKMFKKETTNVAEAVPLHRLYLRGDHLYTISDQEKSIALTSGYAYENIKGLVYSQPGPDRIAVYKFFRPPGVGGSGPIPGENFYTADENEIPTLPALGYINGGIAFYAPTTIPNRILSDTNTTFKDMRGYIDTPGAEFEPNQFGADNDLPAAQNQGFNDADIRNYLETVYRYIPGKRIGPRMQTLLNDPSWGRGPSYSSGTAKPYGSGSNKDGVTYEGPPLASYLPGLISPFFENTLTPTEEIQGKTWIMTWRNVDFPEDGSYNLTTKADDIVIVRVDGVEVGRSLTFEDKRTFLFNATKGKKSVQLELSNVRLPGTGFNENPTYAFVEIIKKSSISKALPLPWTTNPIGISAILIPPPCPKLIKGKGVISRVIVLDPGNNYACPPGQTLNPETGRCESPPVLEQEALPAQLGTPPPPQYPVCLILDEVLVEDPGINYNCGVDKLQIVPDNGVILDYDCDSFGRISRVKILDNGTCFPEYPRITMISDTGVNATFRPVFRVVRDPIDPALTRDNQRLIQVTDLVGLKQTGYIDGRPYYGAVFYENTVRYAGYYKTVGTPIRVYDTLQESITAEVTTPPSAIEKFGTDIDSNNPRLNIPGTPTNLI